MRIAIAMLVSLCAVACGDPVDEPQTIEVTSNQQAVAVDTGDKPPAPPSGDADRPCDRSGGPPPGSPPPSPPDCRKAPDRCPSGSTCASDGLCKDADGHPVRPPPPPPPPQE
jgi:hypothetical protein